jgi:DNA-binding NtrC family response regulator
MAQILVIEDEHLLARTICEVLKDGGHEASTVPNGEDGLLSIRSSPPDLILLDMRLPRMDGLDVLRRLRTDGLSIPVIVMTAHGTIDTAVEAMKLGASEFLTKPLDLGALLLIVERVLERQRVADNLRYFQSRERAESGANRIIGDSTATKELRERICKLARSPALTSDFPPAVLITGETGTGKDLVARAIHYEGPRADEPFVHVNCTAIPDELFESELFGHTKGAFTSAAKARKGLIEVASGGTIFFDEIGHMKPALQAKLLTAIEHKRIRPVGGTSERKVNVHIISATNRDLETAIAAGEFRDDLYHRLRVVPFHLSPLRERTADIETLAKHFVTFYASRSGVDVTGIEDAALELMQRYDWPGNVRELAHALESAVFMCDDHLIRTNHLQIRPTPAQAPAQVMVAGIKTIAIDFERGGSVLDDLEHAILETALEYSSHNLSRAARLLGITREAVRYRLEKHRTRIKESQRDGDR